MTNRMLHAWAAVLDGTLAELAELSRDARTFDRLGIDRLTDVWDNNTSAFVVAASARGSRPRRRLAGQGVRWMADFGADRRTWVLEQAAAAGHPIRLPPLSRDYVDPMRDYSGRVRAGESPLSGSVAADYELETARVTDLCVERSGGRLVGRLRASVDRRFEVGSGDWPDATLQLGFGGIEGLRFDLEDAVGLKVEVGENVSLVIGSEGVVRAAEGTMWIEDSAWHLSTAGRAADAVLPPLSPRKPEPRGGRLFGDAGRAATMLHGAMIEMRMVRVLSHSHRAGVHKLATTFAGAGTDILAAGSAVRRNAAFRRLITRWRTRGGPELAPFFEHGVGHAPPEPGYDLPPTPGSHLLLADYSSPIHAFPSTTTLLYATPGDPWVRRRVHSENTPHFAIDLQAFSHPRSTPNSLQP